MNLLPLTQKVTYWTQTSSDGNGDPAWSAGVAVSARWALQDNIVRDEKGDEQKTEFAIYCTVNIPKRAMVALGDYNGVSLPVAGSRKVMDTYHSPSISSLREVLA